MHGHGFRTELLEASVFLDGSRDLLFFCHYGASHCISPIELAWEQNSISNNLRDAAFFAYCAIDMLKRGAIKSPMERGRLQHSACGFVHG